MGILPATIVYEDTEYSVTSIGERVFANANIASIIISNSVISIGESAFKSSSLTSITIGIGVTSIGRETFKDCENLKVINRVVNIGEWCENDPISYENELNEP